MLNSYLEYFSSPNYDNGVENNTEYLELRAQNIDTSPQKPRRKSIFRNQAKVDNGIGSHQYEEDESEIWRHHQIQMKFGSRGDWWDYDSKRVFRKWIQTFLVGLLTGLVAVFIGFCTKSLSHKKFEILYELIEDERKEKIRFGSAFCFYLFYNLICVSIAWFTVYLAPHAAGSGIPEVKCFLNGLNVNVLDLHTVLCKIIGIIFTVSSGLPAGKEGPMIHAGAGVASLISNLNLVGVNKNKYNSDREKRDLVACGASSGVAAAFGAPIGGVLFSLEEGASFWSTKLTWRCFFCAMITVTILLVIRTMNIHLGQANAAGMFSFGQFFTLKSSVYNFSVYELPLFCIIGAFGGLIGICFNHSNKIIQTYRIKYIVNKFYIRYFEVIVICILMSVISFWLPVLMPNCTVKPTDVYDWTDEEKELTSHLVPLYCEPGTEYNQLASLFLTDSDTAIKQLFHFRELGDNNRPTFSTTTLLFFFIPYLLMACITFGSSVPSGMFVPSLLQGASFGRLVGHILHGLDNSRGTFADSGTFALVGAAAGLGGIARMTISLTVILLEATGDVQYLLPLMITVMAAHWVGNSINTGIYDVHISLKNLPFLEESEDDISLKYAEIRVSDVMTREIVSVSPIVHVGELYDMLVTNTFNCFPVIDEESNGILIGTVLRKVLCSLIKHRAFGHSKWKPVRSDHRASPLVNWETLQGNKSSDGKECRIEDLIISSAERKAWIDLRPYMDRAPHVIYENASFQVVGLITRAELVNSRLEAILLQSTTNSFRMADQYVDEEEELEMRLLNVKDKSNGHLMHSTDTFIAPTSIPQDLDREQKSSSIYSSTSSSPPTATSSLSRVSHSNSPSSFNVTLDGLHNNL